MVDLAGFSPADEQLHVHDPADWSWNESWFFSFVDLEPFTTGRFTFTAAGLVRSGPRVGARVPFTIDLAYRAAGDVHGSGRSESDTAKTSSPIGRFEQPLTATGTVTVGERSYPVRAGAHRDKSWGPRDWRIGFLIGDLQGEDRELYFVGAPAEPVPRVGGYLREGSGELVRLACVEGDLRLDDAHATVAPVHLVFETPDGDRVEVDMTPVGPSVQFDMAHTCEVPEHWCYWRHLVEARVSTWGTPARGWFEASRYGAT